MKRTSILLQRLNVKVLGTIIIGVVLIAGPSFFYIQHVSYSQETLEIQENSVRALFVGDMMFDRGVRGVVSAHGGKYEYLFSEIASSENSPFLTSELTVGNLEGVVAERSEPIKEFDFAFDEGVVPVLKLFNFDAVSLANNHTLDQGSSGFLKMTEVLSKYGLGYFGHQIQEDAPSWETSINGYRIGIAGFNITKQDFNKESGERVIRDLKEKNDIVIIQVHWGEEYEIQASSEQIDLGRDFVDWGADVVIGHHPHVMQGMEVYKGTPIFYSLGNFIFDQEFSAETKQALIVETLFMKDEVSIFLHPILLEGYRPHLKSGLAKEQAIQAFIDRSFLSPDFENQILEGILRISSK